MQEEKEIDVRTRLISLAAAVVIVLSLSFGYQKGMKAYYYYKYQDHGNVTERLYSECSEMVNHVAEKKKKNSSEAESILWMTKAAEECRLLKEQCTQNFKQEMCLLAQKQFQDPQ
jgi:hypothetical protein